jgi:negative regulator of flagellin synthesis FlgM
MKISQPTDNSVALSSNAASLTAKNGPVAGAPVKSAPARTAPPSGVAVTVSSLTRSMEAAGPSDAPDVDMTKVSAMREAIAQGSFAVNPEAIADKLLSNAQEVLQRSRS